MKGRVAVLLLVLLSSAVPAQAQVYTGPSDVPRRGSWEVGGGVIWAGAFEIESRAAELTANSTTNTSDPFTLFDTESEVGSVAGVQARAGFYVTRSISFEAGVQYSRPMLSTSIADDFEDADPITAEAKMSRYVFDGSLVFHLRNLTFSGGRGVPFVAVGAGYLRELHENNELVETGRIYQGSAGIKIWFSQGARRWGLRGEGGLAVRDGGFDGENKRHTVPTAGASLIYLF